MTEFQERGDRIVIDEPESTHSFDNYAWWNAIMDSHKISENIKPIIIFSKLSEA